MQTKILQRLLLPITAILFFLGGISQAQTPPGNTLNFVGAGSSGDDYISVPNNSSIQFTDNLTIEAWIYMTDAVNNTIVDKGDYEYLFQARPNSNTGLGFYNPATGWIYSAGTVPSNQWVHVAVVFKTGTNNTKFYLNGSLLSSHTPTSALTSGTGEMNIGRQSPTTCACNFFDGEIDELKIWNYARTQTEIQNQMYYVTDPTSSGLAAYYNFDEGNGSSISDLTANNNDGTLQNFALIGSTSNWVSSTAPINSNPSVTLGAISNFDEDAGTANVTASFTYPYMENVTVDLGLSPSAGTDYSISNTSIVITAGNTSNFVTLTGINDFIVEGNETITVDIDAVTNGTENGIQQQTVDILDDDFDLTSPGGNIGSGITGESIIPLFTWVSENTATYTVKISTSSDMSGATTLETGIVATGASSTYQTTAAEKLNYNTTYFWQVIGSGTATLVSSEIYEFKTETTPTVTLNFKSGSSSPILETGGSTLIEAKMDKAADLNVTIDLAINGTSTASGGDYSTSAMQLVLSPGATTGDITLSSLSDFDLEGDETVVIDIDAVTNADESGTQQVSVTITDDEIATLVSPVNNATDVSLAPTFVWADMPGADQYVISIYDDNGGSKGNLHYTFTHNDDGSTNNQSVTLSTITGAQLVDNTPYHWEVKGYNTGIPVYSTESISQKFTTAAQQHLGSPTVANGAVDVPINPTLDWAAVAGADAYLLEVNTQSDFGGTSYHNTNVVGATSKDLSGLPHLTTLYWRVTALNNSGNINSGSEIGDAIKTSAVYNFTTVGPTVTLSGGGATIDENSGSTDLTITLGSDIGNDLDVTLTYSGTGVTTSDFSNSTGAVLTETFTFAGGSSAGATKTTTITATNDNNIEGNETISAVLTTASGIVSGSPKSVIITDDEIINLSRDNSSPLVENGGPVVYTATISNSGVADLPANADITVSMTWNTGTATVTDDFINFGNITIADNTNSGSITINSVHDINLEGDETIIGHISSVTEGSIGTNDISTTITDDEIAVLVSPDAGDGPQSLSPILTWEDLPLAEDYSLEVYIGGAGAGAGGTLVHSETITDDGTNNNQTTTLSSPSVTPLLDNTTYYWQITANRTNPVVSSDPSGFFSFTTNQQSLGTPTVADGAIEVPINPTLDWDAVTGADQYYLEIDVNSGFTSAIGSGKIVYTISAPTTSQAVTGLDYNTKYYWRVTGKNTGNIKSGGEVGDAIKSSGTSSFTTNLGPLAQATPGNTASFLYSVNPVNFTWTMPNSISNVKFTVTVDDNANFNNSTGFRQISDVTGARTTPISFTKAGTYYWKVDAIVLSGDNAGETETVAGNFSFTSTLPGPVLTAPVNGLTGVSIEPTLSWNAVTGATSYKLYVDTENTFTLPSTYVVDEGTNLSRAFTELINNFPLSYNTKYYWKVAAVDFNGVEYDSDIYHFTTVQQGPLPLYNPANGANVYTPSNMFTWSVMGLVGSMKFKVQVVANTSPTPTDWASADYESPFTQNLFYTFSNILLGKSYSWRVVAYNAAGEVINYSSVWNFTALGGAITPTLYTPASGATIYTETPIFYWTLNGVATDVTYDLLIDNDADTTNGTTITNGLNRNISTLFKQISSGSVYYGNDYYWTVRSVYKRNDVSARVYGDWASPRSFTISGGNSINITHSYPSNGATVYTNDPFLYWYINESAPGVEFEVCYATESGVDGNGKLTNGTVAVTSLTSNLFIQLTNLDPGQEYFWQVRSKYNAVYGAWTSPTSFTTNGSGTLVEPIVSYPKGGVTVYTTHPTLYWYLNASTAGLTYDIQIKESSVALDNSTVTYNNVNALFFTVTTALTPGTTYHWTVRSDNGTNQSNFATSSGTFTVAGGTSGGYPLVSYPLSNPSIYSRTPSLYWTLEGNSLGLDNYTVIYSTSQFADDAARDAFAAANVQANNDATDGIRVETNLMQTYWTVDYELTNGATYYWSVATKQGSDYSTWSTGSFTVVGGNSNVTVIHSQPSNGSTITSTSTTLYWYLQGSTLGLQGYKVEYSKSDVFDPNVTTEIAYGVQGTSTFAPLSSLTPGATYYWRITPYWDINGSDVAGTRTNEWNFIVDNGTSPIQPIIGNPTNNVAVNTSAPMLSWVIPGEGDENLTYQVEIIGNNETDWSSATVISGITDPFTSIDNLESGEYYKWRVSSSVDGSYPIAPTYGTFRVGDKLTGIGEDAIIPAKFTVEQNYPNPFNPSTIIKFSVAVSEFVSIKIYDILGRELATLLNQQVNAGSHQINWNGLDKNGYGAAAGTYIYRVTAGTKTITKKMMLLK